MFKCVLLIIHLLHLVGGLGSSKLVYHNNWVAILTQADRPQSLCNRSLVLSRCCHVAYWIFLWVLGLLS